jgi:DNA repair exonuclease SbcCD ATPase subunit
MKIVGLDVQNVLRLTALKLEFDPANNLVVIGGNNAQGKTSVLNSIMAALGGTKEHMPEMVHHGAKRGKVVVDLGDFTVTRTFTRDGGGTLTVTAADGKTVTSPQNMLNGLLSSMSFDPLAFMSAKPAEQANTLRTLAGLDFTSYDKEYDAAFAERTDVNRDVRRLEAQLAGMRFHADAPTSEVGVADLTAQLEAEHAKQRAYDNAERSYTAACTRVIEADGLVADLRKRLEQAQSDAMAAHKAKEAAEKAFNALTQCNPVPIQEQIASAESTNQKVRDNAARTRVESELKATRKTADALTAKLDGIRDAKEKAIRDAKFPVEGIGFSDDGVTLNGLPVKQASGAEALRLSVAVGAALNPKLRTMLVRDGSLLDDSNLALLAQLAAGHDFQIFMERVGKRDQMAIIIEDGTVLDADADTKEA